MLTLVKKAIGYILQSPECGDIQEETSDCEDTGGTEEKQPVLRRNVLGKVTHLRSGYGLVDGHIYFGYDTVLGSHRPVVGSSVSVDMVGTEDGGWRALQVSMSESWEDDEKDTSSGNCIANQVNDDDDEECETCLGKITYITGNKGSLNDDIQFELTPGCCEFVPITGDWVTGTGKKLDNGYLLVKSLKPLRQTTMEGPITLVRKEFGVVDDEIYFSIDAVDNGYVARRGDEVRIVAIESAQGRLGWRAINLVPKSTSLTKCRNAMASCASKKPGIIGVGYVKHLLQDKEGVTVTASLDFGNVLLGSKSSIVAIIRNYGAKACNFYGCKLQGSQTEIFSCNDAMVYEKVVTTEEGFFNILPGGNVSVTINCHTKLLGKAKQLMIFEFEGFLIGRHVMVNVQDSNQSLLHPSRPFKALLYKGADSFNLPDAAWVVPGERPNKFSPRQLPISLPQYLVSKKLWNCVIAGEELLDISPWLAEPLNKSNYVSKMQTLLHLEEIQMKLDMQQYDMEQVLLYPEKEYLSLQVPGLAEGRPSLLIGDKVLLSYVGCAAGSPLYEGYINEVYGEEILIKFHQSFHDAYASEPVDIAFQINRTSLRRCHQAVQLALQLGPTIVFPEKVIPKLPRVVAVERLTSCSHCRGPRSSVQQSRNPSGKVPPTVPKLQLGETKKVTTFGVRKTRRLCAGGDTDPERMIKKLSEKQTGPELRKVTTIAAPAAHSPEKNSFAQEFIFFTPEKGNGFSTPLQGSSSSSLGTYSPSASSTLSPESDSSYKDCRDYSSSSRSTGSSNSRTPTSPRDSAGAGSGDVTDSVLNSKKKRQSVIDRLFTPKTSPRDDSSDSSVTLFSQLTFNDFSSDKSKVHSPRPSQNDGGVSFITPRSEVRVTTPRSRNDNVKWTPTSVSRELGLSDITKLSQNATPNKLGDKYEDVPHVSTCGAGDNQIKRGGVPPLVLKTVSHFTIDELGCKVPSITSRTASPQRRRLAVNKANHSPLGPRRKLLNASLKSPAAPRMLTGYRFHPVLSPDKCPCTCHGVPPTDSVPSVAMFLEWTRSDLNERQKSAVRRILGGLSRPTPYVIFGPPGTGKTITVVEAIIQLLRLCPDCRILACTPSNSAADLITERVLKSGAVNKSTLVRLNAFQRSDASIPDSIRLYCNDGENLGLIARHRLVICTCVTAGALYNLGLAHSHFTHVFVDEAGQATEPECMVPLLFASQDGQIILAGDPMQLGPVLRSKLATAYGLQNSFLERLMNSGPYLRDEDRFLDHGCYDPLVVTKLINNYRSHAALLELPSSTFYHSELVMCADESVRNQCLNLEFLPCKDFPLIFHGIQGDDLREGNSPSWFNPAEVMQVMRYLRLLYEHEIKPEDIGIITPYRKQVEKLRLMMESLEIPQPKVGSVEEFQGQEKLVIIISTVRSAEPFLNFDITYNLGFLRNPKRFNVSITRAQSLLIAVGNPHLLSKDQYWCSLLKYCVDAGAYVGCDPPELNKSKEEL